jgi:arylsulfatase A-like enzyme
MMPAHGSIFTGLYPRTHGATHIGRQLDDASQTLAEVLSERGYYCVGFCCAPRLTSERGFGQGFHVYDDYSVPMLLETLEQESATLLDINSRRTNDMVNDAVISWLRKNTHTPLFLFVHYYDNHWDYVPPPPYRGLYDPDYEGRIDGTRVAREPLYSNRPDPADLNHLIALYDGEVRQTDDDLGQLLAAIEEVGLAENSIIVVMGDHGEQFYEHGNTSHQGLYEELIHIPLVFTLPQTHTQGKTIDAIISQIDIMPTILDYLDIPIPDACQGKSLKPLIEGQAESIRDFVLAEYTAGAVPDVFAVRSRQYKCVGRAEGEILAYDLFTDPGEQRPILFDSGNAELTTLQAALRAWVPSEPTSPPDADH